MSKNKGKMNKTAMILIILVATLAIAGCQQTVPANNASAMPEKNLTVQKKPADIVEKRGVKTNITEFNTLVARASNIKSYAYTLHDTLYPEQDTFYYLNRYVRVVLPGERTWTTGEAFDEVYLDRLTKTALSHCSIRYCPKPNLDKELEITNYDKYYKNDPLEYLYKITDANYVRDDMIGDQYVKVFNMTFDGKEGTAWLQEYYGFPIKIVIPGRTVEFLNMTIDNTRLGLVELPFNFTVKGKEGHWFFWEHYLGEWPQPGQDPDQALQELLNGTAPKTKIVMNA